MAMAQDPDTIKKLKKRFQVSDTAMRSELNHHYSTVSGPTASRLGDNFSKDFYPLNPVPEDHFFPHHSADTSPKPILSPTSPLPSSTNKSVSWKPNFFNKRDSTSPIQPSKPSKPQGKMKNFISSIRQRSKSTCSEAPPIFNNNTPFSIDQDASMDDGVFTMSTSFNAEQRITELTLSDNNLNNTSNNTNNTSNSSNNTSNNTDMMIGPDQYLAYHRDRTQSDTTKFLIARKQARDKAKNSPLFRTLNPSRHHSACLDESDLCLDTRLLIWKDPKKGTRVYRMPSNSQRFNDSDELVHPDLVYTKLLDKYTCYDVIPASSKIVVFDSRLSIKKAFLALAKDGVKAAILWDTSLQDFSGMLTITDFIKILYKYYTASEVTRVEDLENDSINMWKGVLQCRSLVSCAPENTLLTALKLLCQHRVHRLLVMDSKLGNAINILTHKRILAFIHYNMTSIDAPPFLNKPLSSFPYITLDKVTTITYSTKLIQVLRLFIEQRISAVPVVDADGRLVNIFAKFDFSRLAYDNLYSNLDRPVRDVINASDELRVEMHTIQPHIPLSRAIHKIVTASVHRLVLVDDDRRVVGMATLSDLLRCLVLQPEDANKKG